MVPQLKTDAVYGMKNLTAQKATARFAAVLWLSIHIEKCIKKKFCYGKHRIILSK